VARGGIPEFFGGNGGMGGGEETRPFICGFIVLFIITGKGKFLHREIALTFKFSTEAVGCCLLMFFYISRQNVYLLGWGGGERTIFTPGGRIYN
jgi:hypothetical protein